jgi:hypothetical protein
MWSGFDSDLQQQWKFVREMVALQRQTPKGEWPLVVIHEYDALFVVREWPNGSMTSYAIPISLPPTEEQNSSKPQP